MARRAQSGISKPVEVVKEEETDEIIFGDDEKEIDYDKLKEQLE